MEADEGTAKFNSQKLRQLRPVFKKGGGSVTAGNASPVSDGAAALVLASYETATQVGDCAGACLPAACKCACTRLLTKGLRLARLQRGLPILACLRGQADANQVRPHSITPAVTST